MVFYQTELNTFQVFYQTELNKLEINFCVPQYSVIGHILFLFYIKDLPKISSDFKAILFAVDTNLIFRQQKISTLKSNIYRYL